MVRVINQQKKNTREKMIYQIWNPMILMPGNKYKGSICSDTKCRWTDLACIFIIKINRTRCRVISILEHKIVLIFMEKLFYYCSNVSIYFIFFHSKFNCHNFSFNFSCFYIKSLQKNRCRSLRVN